MPTQPSPAPATPLPWKLGYRASLKSGEIALEDMDSDLVAVITDHWQAQETRDQNAAYIVTACNAFPALVEALGDCIKSMERLPDVDGAYRVTCLEQARAALALAKGGVK